MIEHRNRSDYSWVHGICVVSPLHESTYVHVYERARATTSQSTVNQRYGWDLLQMIEPFETFVTLGTLVLTILAMG